MGVGEQLLAIVIIAAALLLIPSAAALVVGRASCMMSKRSTGPGRQEQCGARRVQKPTRREAPVADSNDDLRGMLATPTAQREFWRGRALAAEATAEEAARQLADLEAEVARLLENCPLCSCEIEEGEDVSVYHVGCEQEQGGAICTEPRRPGAERRR